MIAAPPLALAKESVSVGDPCATKGKTFESGALLLECGPQLRWRSAIEGKPCVKDAAMVGDLSCMRRQSQRQWMKRYVYQDQACDPEDPRLAAENVILPTIEHWEARIAAACVAIRWIEREEAVLPELLLLSATPISLAAQLDAQRAATAGLRLTWEYRGTKDIIPTYIIFSSPSEFCQQSKRFMTPDRHAIHLRNGFSTDSDGRPWLPDCSDARPFSEEMCESGPAGGLFPGFSYNGRLAGAFQLVCASSLEYGSNLSLHKFWQGIGAFSVGSRSREVTADAFTGALINMDGMLVLYPQLLDEARSGGRQANLCGPGATLYICAHNQWKDMPELFRSSRVWWRDGVLTNDISAAAGWSRQTAAEWFVAHFGLDAAFFLPHALVGVSNRAQYLKVLKAYTNISPKKLFAGIDAYVGAQFGREQP